jgi:cytochrome bd-type quinol oxidase subunit 2
LRVEIDKTQREVFSREVDLKKSAFQLSRRALIRIVLGFAIFLLPIWIAYHFEQYPQMWMAIVFAILVSAWQLLFYGYESSPKDEASLKVTNFYSKGVLIFLAIFWAVLISGVSVALYLKVP